MERHVADRLVLSVATEAERLLRTKLYSHLRKIPICMVLEVCVQRREQRVPALRESMEVSDAVRAVLASRAAIDTLEKTKLHEALSSCDDGCTI
ncbi:RING-type domain-containing protein [Psidium guajava]|nr:RING-type domain-containing protein [Psidium guajava]